jgi:hypothetical protein
LVLPRVSAKMSEPTPRVAVIAPGTSRVPRPVSPGTSTPVPISTRTAMGTLMNSTQRQLRYSGRLGLDPEDLRLQVLAELATTAFSVSGRHWVRHGGRGGREVLLERLDGAVRAIPASLDLSALLRRQGVGRLSRRARIA